MLIDRLRRNPEKKKKLAHVIAGFVILLHAFERYESGHASYLFFAVAGIVFMSVALLHAVIERKAPWIDGVFFVIEAALSFLVAADYFHMGKKALPYCYLAAGIAQLVVAFVKSKKGIRQHKAAQ